MSRAATERCYWLMRRECRVTAIADSVCLAVVEGVPAALLDSGVLLLILADQTVTILLYRDEIYSSILYFVSHCFFILHVE